MTVCSASGYFLKFPLFIKWNITSKCNLRCGHCFLENYQIEPSFEIIKKIILLFKEKKVVNISFTGGEPFIRNDFIDIIKFANREGLRFDVASNGLLLAENPNLISECIKNSLTDFQISLDGAIKDTHDKTRGKGTFDKALRAISLLKKLGAVVTIGFTVNKSNIGELDKIYEISNAMGVDNLRFELFLPIGTGLKNDTLFSLSPLDIKLFAEKISDKKELTTKIQLPCFMNSERTNENMTLGCGAGTSSCILNSDLSLSACDLLSESERSAPMLEVSDFEKIWKNSSVFHKWRNIIVKSEHCENCKLNRKCGLGCRASALAYNNDFNAEDPLCLFRNK